MSKFNQENQPEKPVQKSDEKPAEKVGQAPEPEQDSGPVDPEPVQFDPTSGDEIRDRLGEQGTLEEIAQDRLAQPEAALAVDVRSRLADQAAVQARIDAAKTGQTTEGSDD